jgi:hypothetical protein
MGLTRFQNNGRLRLIPFPRRMGLELARSVSGQLKGLADIESEVLWPVAGIPQC